MATLVICTRRQRPRLLPRTLSSALVRTAAARLALCSCHRGNQRRLASERLRRARGGGIYLIRSPHARLAHHQCPRHLERRRYRRHSHGHRQSHARPLFAPFFALSLPISALLRRVFLVFRQAGETPSAPAEPPYIAVGLLDGTIAFWPWCQDGGGPDRRSSRTTRHDRAHGCPVTCIKLLNGSLQQCGIRTLLCASGAADGSIQLYDMRATTLLAALPSAAASPLSALSLSLIPPHSAAALAAGASGQPSVLVAAGGIDGRVQVWSLAAEAEPRLHTSWVDSLGVPVLDFALHGDALLTVSEGLGHSARADQEGAQIEEHDISTGKLRERHALKVQASPIVAAEFVVGAPDGNAPDGNAPPQLVAVRASRAMQRWTAPEWTGGGARAHVLNEELRNVSIGDTGGMYPKGAYPTGGADPSGDEYTSCEEDRDDAQGILHPTPPNATERRRNRRPSTSTPRAPPLDEDEEAPRKYVPLAMQPHSYYPPSMPRAHGASSDATLQLPTVEPASGVRYDRPERVRALVVEHLPPSAALDGGLVGTEPRPQASLALEHLPSPTPKSHTQVSHPSPTPKSQSEEQLATSLKPICPQLSHTPTARPQFPPCVNAICYSARRSLPCLRVTRRILSSIS